MHQLFLQFLLNQIYKLTDYLILLFLFFHCFYFCIKKTVVFFHVHSAGFFSIFYSCLFAHWLLWFACGDAPFCEQWPQCNDEYDVSNDVDDDGVNKDGNKNYDDDGAPFCEQRPQ